MSQKQRIHDKLPGMQDVLESVIVLVTRAVLGFFLSAILGWILYAITLPIVQAISQISEFNAGLIGGVLVFGFGAGVGSFLGWFNRDISRTIVLLMLFLSLASALLGAWGGLHNSRDVINMVGVLGSPALMGIFVGALLGGNIFNITIGVLRTVRSPRVR